MRHVLDMLPDDTKLCPGWLLVTNGRVVLLEVGGVKLAPLFPTADIARQFLAFCGDPADAYPSRPDDALYLLLREGAHRDGCRGLLVITGVHPWHAVACSGTGQWSLVPKPDRVERCRCPS